MHRCWSRDSVLGPVGPRDYLRPVEEVRQHIYRTVLRVWHLTEKIYFKKRMDEKEHFLVHETAKAQMWERKSGAQ